MEVLIEYSDLVEQEKNDAHAFVNQIHRLTMLLMKYKAQWALRHLEQEIDTEGCRIVMSQNGQYRIISSNPDLVERIERAINSVKPD